MNEVPASIAAWLEKKRRTDQISAAVLSAVALSSGAAVFLLMTLPIYFVLAIVAGAFIHSLPPWLGLVALGLSAGIFVRSMKSWQEDPDIRLDPLGYWIIKDICSVGPRLILEGFRQVRRYGELGDLNVPACAQALAFLAEQKAAVDWQDLMEHCPQSAWPRLKEQFFLLDGVLFLGEDAARVTLMEPFRLRLRWMLPKEPARPRPEPAPKPVPVNEPETLTPYEILGLSPSASAMEIKTAYRKRMKECHPDLFAGMDEHAQVLAERWTKALNAAYATLNPRQGGTRPNSTGRR
jgi:DnaJ-domain-containing protein 1